MGCSVHKVVEAQRESAARAARTDCSVHKVMALETPAGLAADRVAELDCPARKRLALWEVVTRAAMPGCSVHRAGTRAVAEVAARKAVVDLGAETPVQSGRRT